MQLNTTSRIGTAQRSHAALKQGRAPPARYPLERPPIARSLTLGGILLTRTCTRSLALAAVVVVALMTSSSDVKAAYNCSYSAAWTGSLQGTWDTSANLTYHPDCLSRYVDFGDGQNDHTVICGNAAKPARFRRLRRPERLTSGGG